MNRFGIAAAAAALALTLGACSSSSSPAKTSGPAPSTPATSTAGSSAPAATGGGITISSFKFSGTMTVKPGQKVSVTNNDSVAHTLTDTKTHLFDTGNIDASGGTGTFTAPKKPGSYPFGCTYHPQMAGTLIVK